jgi:hypothetical protein
MLNFSSVSPHRLALEGWQENENVILPIFKYAKSNQKH